MTALTSDTFATLHSPKPVHATTRFRVRSPESQKARTRSDCIDRAISKLLSAPSMGDRTSKDNLVCRGSKKPGHVDESASHQSSHRKQHRPCNPIVAVNAWRAYEHISRPRASQARRPLHP